MARISESVAALYSNDARNDRFHSSSLCGSVYKRAILRFWSLSKPVGSYCYSLLLLSTLLWERQSVIAILNSCSICRTQNHRFESKLGYRIFSHSKLTLNKLFLN